MLIWICLVDICALSAELTVNRPSSRGVSIISCAYSQQGTLLLSHIYYYYLFPTLTCQSCTTQTSHCMYFSYSIGYTLKQMHTIQFIEMLIPIKPIMVCLLLLYNEMNQ